ncbi:MAG: ybgC [Firmicutes bacterium]|nr:ybgC [Bacillota bacterium]
MVPVKNRVRFVETDLMGVVHHSNYFCWFEMGRVEYMRQAGVLITDLLAAGIVFPISDVSCKYRASAKFDDNITIETTLVDLSKVKMIFNYRVVRPEDGTLLATGSTKNAFSDVNGKIVRLPAQYFDLLQAALLKEQIGPADE